MITPPGFTPEGEGALRGSLDVIPSPKNLEMEEWWESNCLRSVSPHLPFSSWPLKLCYYCWGHLELRSEGTGYPRALARVEPGQSPTVSPPIFSFPHWAGRPPSRTTLAPPSDTKCKTPPSREVCFLHFLTIVSSTWVSEGKEYTVVQHLGGMCGCFQVDTSQRTSSFPA